MKNSFRQLLSDFSRQGNFSTLIYLGCFLLVTAFQHAATVIRAMISDSPLTLLNYSDALYALICSALLILLIRTRRAIPLAYAFNLAFFVSHSSTILLEAPEKHVASLMWYAVYPVTMVATRSLTAILFGLAAVLISAAVLMNIFSGNGTTSFIAGMSDVLSNPHHLQILTFILLFGFSASMMFHLMLQTYERHHQKSIFDNLTGLHNRQVLELDLHQLFKRYQQQGKIFYLSIINLDKFKDINDLFGHTAGDVILQSLGKRLQSLVNAFNQGGIQRVQAYRFGGDQFIVLFSTPVSSRQLDELMGRIRQVTSLPYELDNTHVVVECSLGVARVGPDIESAEEMMRFADISLYAAKSGHASEDKRSNHPVFEEWQRRFAIFKALEEAIEADQISLLYQPVFHSQSPALRGYEVQLHWESAQLGRIPAHEAILIAEATGQIDRLSEWMIVNALHDMQPCLQDYPQLVMSFNISSQLIQDRYFANRLRRWQQNSRCQAHSLELEIVETAAIVRSRQAARLLEPIHELGVRLLLNDYGQGKSSFFDLKNSSFRSIKLDPALVAESTANPEISKIVEAVIDTTHSLDINVIANGVITAQQHKMMQTLGCDFLQGDFLAEPMTAEELIQWVNETDTLQSPDKPKPIQGGNR